MCILSQTFERWCQCFYSIIECHAKVKYCDIFFLCHFLSTSWALKFIRIKIQLYKFVLGLCELCQKAKWQPGAAGKLSEEKQRVAPAAPAENPAAPNDQYRAERAGQWWARGAGEWWWWRAHQLRRREGEMKHMMFTRINVIQIRCLRKTHRRSVFKIYLFAKIFHFNGSFFITHPNFF